jgi:hypothetical protein
MTDMPHAAHGFLIETLDALSDAAAGFSLAAGLAEPGSALRTETCAPAKAVEAELAALASVCDRHADRPKERTPHPGWPA